MLYGCRKPPGGILEVSQPRFLGLILWFLARPSILNKIGMGRAYNLAPDVCVCVCVCVCVSVCRHRHRYEDNPLNFHRACEDIFASEDRGVVLGRNRPQNHPPSGQLLPKNRIFWKSGSVLTSCLDRRFSSSVNQHHVAPPVLSDTLYVAAHIPSEDQAGVSTEASCEDHGHTRPVVSIPIKRGPRSHTPSRIHSHQARTTVTHA